ncbi:MAG: hypothetical protein CM15mP103_10500 [Gammaproteobacteria bacterium]|nr:MAG: hypothetical protein CM15mP103_10500 [Gammaproteobacteria bacterium]
MSPPAFGVGSIEIIPDSSDSDIESFAPSGIILSGGPNPSPHPGFSSSPGGGVQSCFPPSSGFATAKTWPRAGRTREGSIVRFGMHSFPGRAAEGFLCGDGRMRADSNC